MSHPTFKTRDGKKYPLWNDINEIMESLRYNYWRSTPEKRKERGWMFRGQINSDMHLTPTLFRAPLKKNTIDMRQKYTKSFIDALKNEGSRLQLSNMTDLEYYATAQHYGFPTNLLDFSRNVEVAAYFGTYGGKTGQIGVLYCFQIKEYLQLRNPFSMFGKSKEFADQNLKSHNLQPLPDLELIEPDQVLRIKNQEGLFTSIEQDDIDSIEKQCIDRYYFRQKANRVYHGELTDSFLFPTNDPILKISESCKKII